MRLFVYIPVHVHKGILLTGGLFLGLFRAPARATFVAEQKLPKISLEPTVLRIPS